MAINLSGSVAGVYRQSDGQAVILTDQGYRSAAELGINPALISVETRYTGTGKLQVKTVNGWMLATDAGVAVSVSTGNNVNITSNGTGPYPKIGDVLTIVVPYGAEASDYNFKIDRGAGFVSLSTGSLTYTLQAGDIPPTGQTWPIVGRAVPSNLVSGAFNVTTSPPVVPGAPTIGTAVAGVATVTAPYTAPASNGGAAITSYDAFMADAAGNVIATLTNVPNPVVFTAAQGVINGTGYKVAVRANNSVGPGPLSAFSNVVTPAVSGDSATGVTLFGPTSGIPGQPSNKFFLAAAAVSGSATYLASNPAGDTFTPSNPTLTAAVKSATFTMSQLAVGTSAVNITNTGGFENPAAASYVTADTSGTVFTEPWNSASANWAQGANPTTVSGNRMYGTAGAGAGMNHSYAIAAGQSMRAVFPVTIAVGSTTGGLAVGVNQDAAGAVPTSGLGNVFGLYFNFTAGRIDSYNNGAVTQVTASTLPRGDYLVTVTVDPTYISVSADKTDNTVGFFIRRARAGFNINNLALFNSDAAGTSGSSVGPMSARKALQTIIPRTSGEGSTASSMMWTGNSAATIGYAVWYPPGYDSTVSYPLALMFHGDGSDELAFNSDPTYPTMRRAFASAGYICMSVGIAANKSTWGSQAAVDAYFGGWQYIYDKCRISNTVFLGCSMGGIESLNSLSKGNIPGVVAWIGYSPTTSLATAYASAWTAKINTSYGINGGNPYATATAGYDPLLAAPDAFRKVPMLFAHATDDAVVPKSSNTDALVARVTGVASEVVSLTGITGGHSYAPSQSVLNQMIAFADKYAKVGTPTLRQVATGTFINNVQHGSNKQANSRTPHYMRGNSPTLQIVLTNWWVGAAEVNGSGTDTYTAALEYPQGTFTPITFGGNAAGVIAPGANIVSDTVAAPPIGAKFWIRLFLTSTGLIKYQSFYAGDGTAQQEAAVSGLTDKTMGGSMTVIGSTDAGVICPAAIIGMSTVEAVAFVGDSISVGRGDTDGVGRALQGHYGRAFGAVLPCGHLGISGDTFTNFLASPTKRIALSAYFTRIAANMGQNDVSQGASAATVQTQTNTYIGLFGGKPVAFSLFCPISTSTDAWTTVGNQTTVATNTVRADVNIQRRTNFPLAKVVYDLPAVVENVVSPEDGIWNVTGGANTNDGTHHNSNSAGRISATINTYALVS